MEKQIVELGVISYKEMKEKIRSSEINWCYKVKLHFTLEDMSEKCIFPKEIAHKFIIALTSGCYSQTVLKFASIDKTGKTSYCVMGVLLHILGASTISLTRTVTDITKVSDNSKLLSTIYKLNKGNTWSQFSDSIRCMNDYGSMSFSEIAEWIKRNIETI